MKTTSWFLMISLLCCAAPVSAATDENDRAKEDVERRQKIGIGQFFAGSGNAPMTPMAIGLYNDAVKFFQANEFEMAREALKESLALEPRNALALELWGDIENLQQDFEKAEDYYKQGYLVSPSSRLREKLEKIQKEHAVEKNLDTYDEEHFIIKYREGEEGYDGYWLKNMLREVYRSISQDLGAYFNHKTAVLFYAGTEFHDVTGQAGWVGGLYDGKIRLPAFKQGFRESELRAAAAHEMTHAFVANLSGMQAPMWIHEGLAQYEQNKIQPVNTIVFDAAVKTGALIPLQKLFLEDLKIEGADPLEVSLFYQESFNLVVYMIERYQLYRMKEILAKFKDGTPSEQAVEEVTGISVTQLEKEWLATLPRPS